MAKEIDEEVMIEEPAFKSVKFGGYDKTSVDFYISDMKADHKKEVDELKANVTKLSEAVLSLKTMREVNQQESSKTIEALKAEKADYETELADVKEQLEAYKQREFESAGRYESISRTLLEARESADTLIAQTTKKCADKETEVNEACEALEKETADKCERLENEAIARCNELDTNTKAQCQAMYDKAEASCNTMKEQAYSESERLRTKAREDAEALSAQTTYECQTKMENAKKEADTIVNTATSEAYMLRKNVKKECEAVSSYMSDLLSSVDNVVSACNSTKLVADKAFSGLNSGAAEADSSDK